MVALLSYLDAHPYKNGVIIFDDHKRFARDIRFHLDLCDAFRERNARVECLNFKFDDTPEGEFFEIIIAAQSQLERQQNGRQVAQKMKARMQNGYWIHNAPVGLNLKRKTVSEKSFFAMSHWLKLLLRRLRDLLVGVSSHKPRSNGLLNPFLVSPAINGVV